MLANACSEGGMSMRKIAISPGFSGVFVASGRFLFAPHFLAERADSAARLLLAAGLFTIAIATAVRK
jgi:hypothetical protein